MSRLQRMLARVDAPPKWVQDFSDEIDALRFGPGFDMIDGEVDWSIGTRTGRGAEELKDYFRKVAGNLDTRHRPLEVWSGPGQHIGRGEADIAPKNKGEAPVVVPFVWIFYLDAEPEKLRRVYIVNGPVRTEAVL